MENESRIVSTGSVIYIPSQLPFSKKCLGAETSGWYISLPKAHSHFMPNKVSSVEYSHLAYWLGKKIVSWEFSNNQRPAYEHLVMTFLHELKCLIKLPEFQLPFPKDEKLKVVAKNIYENPTDMNTLDYWAKVAAKSRRVFTDSWKCETGLTFGAWRQRLKILVALKMLAQKKAVSEVSTALGYRNTSTFNVMFRKEFGVSPLKYIRTEARGNKNFSGGR